MRLRLLLGKRHEAGAEDGFGQSLFEDLQFLFRFLQCRRRIVVWRRPSTNEAAIVAAHPVFGRFGDATVAVADVDGARWIVRENDFYGWPDPPRYAFFAVEGDRITATGGFTFWVKAWSYPCADRSAGTVV